jgi:hypothetical protein
MSNDQQGFPWIPLLVGVVIGLVGGVYYAWYLNPVHLTNVSPQQLTADDQRAYVMLVSEAYLQEADLERARARLSATGAHDLAQLVVSQANNAYMGGADLHEVRALTILAQALGGDPLADMFPTTAPTVSGKNPTATFEGVPSPTPSPVVPTATSLPVRPTVTPTPVLIPPDTTLKLIANEPICKDDYPAGRIEVYVNDMGGNGIPAIEILVEWAEQQATFFTGLKPEIDPGYADFQMEPNQTYTVTLVGLAEPVFGIDSHACETDSGTAQVPTYQLVYAPAMDQP